MASCHQFTDDLQFMISSGSSPVDGAEFRNLGTEHGGGDRAEALDRLPDPGAAGEFGIVCNERTDRILDPCDLLLELLDHVGRHHDRLGDLVFPVGIEVRGLVRSQLRELRACPSKVDELELLVAERFRHVRTRDLAPPCQLLRRIGEPAIDPDGRQLPA